MKDKLKKIIFFIPVFLWGLISKVFATAFETMYGVEFDPIQTKYGVQMPEPKISLLEIVRLISPIILFFIGFCVILKKKISKKLKLIILFCLIIIGVLLDFIIKDLM